MITVKRFPSPPGVLYISTDCIRIHGRIYRVSVLSRGSVYLNSKDTLYKLFIQCVSVPSRGSEYLNR